MPLVSIFCSVFSRAGNFFSFFGGGAGDILSIQEINSELLLSALNIYEGFVYPAGTNRIVGKP
jgi:hypothetical protein